MAYNFRQSLDSIHNNYAFSVAERAGSANIGSDYSKAQEKMLQLKRIIAGESRKKVDGGYWSIQSRIQGANKVLNQLREYKDVLTQDEAIFIKDMLHESFQNNRYWRTKASQNPELQTAYKSLDSALQTLYTAPVKQYNLPQAGVQKISESTTARRPNQRGMKRLDSLLIGAAILASSLIGGYVGSKVQNATYQSKLNQKEARIEQLVQENNQLKESSLIPTAYAAEHEAKPAEAYKAPENKGNLPNRVDHRSDVPEFTQEQLTLRDKVRDKTNAIGQRLNRNAKRAGNGVYNVVTSPFKFLYHAVTLKPKQAGKDVLNVLSGASDTLNGSLGTVNSTAEVIVRPVVYSASGANEKVDKLVYDAFDASFGGDFNEDAHKDALKFWTWFKPHGLFGKQGKLIKHPIKSAITIAEDVGLAFLIAEATEGSKDSAEAASSGSSGSPGGLGPGDVLIPGGIGRRGGAATPVRGGGAAAVH